VQLADFKIDESRSPHRSFRVTIDRIDQGRVAVITNLARIQRSSAHCAQQLRARSRQLPADDRRLSWRGDPEPDSWITIGIVR